MNGGVPSGISMSPPEQKDITRSQEEVNYRPTDRYRRCWNCGHFRVSSACALVEGIILADHMRDLWAEEWGGKKARSGFRVGRRKYPDEAWASEGQVSDLRPVEAPLDPGTYLCLGCAEEWSLTSRSLALPHCPSCGDRR